MTVRYYRDDQLVIKNLTPQMIEDSHRHGLCLVAEDTLPNDAYLRRYQRLPADIARFASHINMPASNYMFDEENESPDDYLKYCLLALEEELEPHIIRRLKNVILEYRYDDVNYFRWWQSSYQFEFVNIIRRVNDTDHTIIETLKRIQGALQERKKEHPEEYSEDDPEDDTEADAYVPLN
jgi:hypothetical protein